MAVLQAESTFSERVFNLLDNTEYRLMVSGEDREAAFRLRHDAYFREGYIDRDPRGLSADFLDDKPNNHTVGVFIAGQLVSSFRVHILTAACPEGLSMVCNSAELQPKLDAGMVLIDPSRFVTEASAAREFPELPYLTVRVPVMACEHYLADECLSSVRKAHAAFYRRVFRSKPIADPVMYDLLRMEVQLLSCDVPQLRSELYVRYPFLASTHIERRALFGPADAMIGIESSRVNIAA